MLQVAITIALMSLSYYIGNNRGNQNEETEGSSFSSEQEHKPVIIQKSVEDRNKNIKRVIHHIKFCTNDMRRFLDYKPVEADIGNVTYEYKDDSIMYSIYYEHGKHIDVNIDVGDESILSFTYDLKQKVQLKKELNGSLFELGGDNNFIESLEKFLFIIINNEEYWGKVSHDTIIRRNQKNRNESSIDNDQERPEQIVKVSISEDLKHLHSLIIANEKNIDNESQAMFMRILDKMNTCLYKIDDFDTEIRYLVEHLLQRDLKELLLAYSELSPNYKEEAKENVHKALDIVDRKTSEIIALFEKRNLHEVERAVQVIEGRSY